MPKFKILVCGATGFIGRNIAEYYAKNPEWEVHAVYNKRPPFRGDCIVWHKCDLTNGDKTAALIETVAPTKIVQAAATTSGSKDIVSRPHIHVTDNAVMNSYIFKTAAENNVEHLVFFSCTVMYQSSDKPIKEDDYDANMAVHPRYFGVANTKIYLEKMCEFYSSLGQTKFTAIRHSNIYGRYDKFDFERSHFFGATISKVMTSDKEIVVWGTGEEERDLLYIDDLTDFVDCVFKRQADNFRLYHCGSGQSESVKSVVKKIVAASGKIIEIQHDLSMPTIKTSLCIDCTRALEELEWQPRVSLEDGIARTIDWWEKNIDAKTLQLKST